MPPAPGADPFGAFHFHVEIEGVTRAAFVEASGLESESAVIEYRTGDTVTTRKLPGRTTFPTIVLRRGLTNDRELWTWRKSVVDGHVQRRAGSIVLRNAAGEELLRWSFREGWPCKWQGPLLNAGVNAVAIETLEIAHEGLELGG